MPNESGLTRELQELIGQMKKWIGKDTYEDSIDCGNSGDVYSAGQNDAYRNAVEKLEFLLVTHPESASEQEYKKWREDVNGQFSQTINLGAGMTVAKLCSLIEELQRNGSKPAALSTRPESEKKLKEREIRHAIQLTTAMVARFYRATPKQGISLPTEDDVLAALAGE